MEKVDQDARLECVKFTADDQIKCLAEIDVSIDAPNTKRLITLFERYGFPTVEKVGREGQQAFMILLQHCNSDELRKKCLKPVKKAFVRKELKAMDYANF